MDNIYGNSFKNMNAKQIENVYGGEATVNGSGDVIKSVTTATGKLSAASVWSIKISAVATASVGLYTYIKKCL